MNVKINLTLSIILYTDLGVPKLFPYVSKRKLFCLLIKYMEFNDKKFNIIEGLLKKRVNTVYLFQTE